MAHSITFYGLDSHEFSRRMREARSQLLHQIEQRVRSETPESEYDEPGLRLVIESTDRICQGDIPSDCGPGDFYALGWLAEVAMERITICPFQGFSQLSFLDEIGIWPWLLRLPPPFPVPICSQPPPQVGFLSLQDMQSWALCSFDKLPPIDCRDVTNARDEFKDVLESLVADKLDLLAVLL